jgi:hypothetical protein
MAALGLVEPDTRNKRKLLTQFPRDCYGTGGTEMNVRRSYTYIHTVTCTPEERRYLGTARQAAEEEGVTRKRLATKQYQGSVSYGVSSQAIYREPCTSKS